MTTNYPTSLDTFTNPTATDQLDSATVPHAAQHDNINDAVLAVETALGANLGNVVLPARSISTTAPLTGGGDLSANRTLSLNTGSSLTTSGSNLVVDSTIVPFLANANIFTTSPQTINGAASAVGLIVQANATTPGNLQEWKNSAGTNLASVSATGTITATSGGFVSGNVSISGDGISLITNGGTTIRNTDGTTVPFAIRAGSTTQTGNLLQISTYNNAATLPAYVPVFRINGTGQVEGNNPTTVPLTVRQSSTTFSVFATTAGNPSSGKVRYQYINSYNYFAVGQSVTISGLSPSGYNGTFTIETVGLVTGTAYYFTVANATTGTATGTGTITPAFPSDLQQWRNTSNAVIAAIGANGTMAMGTTAGAPTIASATTIAPVTPIAFISGTTAIATITAPAPISTNGGSIQLIPTGIFTTTTAGNIALASTAVVSRTMTMTYDPVTTKWYPSY